MTKERLIVERLIGVDTKRLYGPLSGAIEYLKEVSITYAGTDIALTENWTGYEDMSMSFIYHEKETDEEYHTRRKYEELREKLKAEDEYRKAKNAKVLAKIEKLKGQLS